MLYRIIFLFVLTFICLIASVSATKFRVVHALDYKVNKNLDSRKLAVRIDNNLFYLDNKQSKDPLIYTTIVPQNLTRTYQYVILNETNQEIEREPFYRVYVDSPPLDLYGHPSSLLPNFQILPKVKFSHPAYQNYHYSGQEVHPYHEIPTLHIRVDPEQLKTLHVDILKDPLITANISRISSERVDIFENVHVSLSGQTSKLFKKLSYGIKIPKTTDSKALDGFRRFKLRSCATDPSYMREKLYYDILEASQVPTARSSYIRLFINQEPQGLYLMADHYKNPFTKNTFGKDKSKYKHGALFQGAMQENPMAVGKLRSGANLEYLGPREQDYIEPTTQTSAYKIQESSSEDHSLMPLITFIEFIESTKTWKGSMEALEEEWNKRVDVPVFLKNFALELLLGHNDGYLGAAHNYLLYQDPEQGGKLVWLPSDLDQTMGSSLVPRIDPKEIKSILGTVDQFGLLKNMSRRPLISQLLKVESIKSQFYQILTDYHHYLFETDAIRSHIIYLKSLIQQDVQWDQRLKRVDHFQANSSVFSDQLEQKILQLPLGKDFYERIDKIEFITAIQGSIMNHPSITSLVDFFATVNQAATKFVLYLNPVKAI
ncbi:unnamed protein product [Rhizopus stolonifer]